MIQHGIICPQHYLEDFATKSRFHLILPHLYEAYPRYKEFYKERIKQGDFVVQDNSIFELEKSLPSITLLEFAEELGVSEMSAPEVLRSSVASKKILGEFLKFKTVTYKSSIPVLAVAQGKTIQEIIDYIFYLNSISEISTIGIPFDLEYLQNDTQISYRQLNSLTLRRVLKRWELIDILNQEAENRNEKVKPLHLMGLSDAVELQYYKHLHLGKDEFGMEKYVQIRSNDSSSAYVHGSRLIKYYDRGLPCEKVSEKLNFGEVMEKSKEKIAMNTIFKNIKTIQRFCK